MIEVLSFVLECAAICAAVGITASVAAVVLWRWSAPLLQRMSPRSQADVAFIIGIVPATLAVLTTLAAAAPPLMATLGLIADHCLHHDHHAHLCLVHSAGLRPAVATLGAVSLAVFSFRLVSLLSALHRTRKSVSGMEAIGRRMAHGSLAPVIEIPSELHLCHALGVVQGRILLSTSVVDAISAEHLDCAIAHESAHLHRRDPMLHLLLHVASLFVLPGISMPVRRAFAAMSEEAADEEAARRMGDGPLMAEALLAVAALQKKTPFEAFAPAFGRAGLERRVRRLLKDVPLRERRSYGLALALGLVAPSTVVALVHSHSIHHAVETALHSIF